MLSQNDLDVDALAMQDAHERIRVKEFLLSNLPVSEAWLLQPCSSYPKHSNLGATDKADPA